jgi:hypothetical protein
MWSGTGPRWLYSSRVWILPSSPSGWATKVLKQQCLRACKSRDEGKGTCKGPADGYAIPTIPCRRPLVGVLGIDLTALAEGRETMRPTFFSRSRLISPCRLFISNHNYAAFNKQSPGSFLTALLDLTSKDRAKFPVAFQKEPCHCSCWKPKG